MTFKKGDKRPPNAGRKVGTPNKRRSIEDLCIEAGVDPFQVMIRVMQADDIGLKFQAAKELAQYLEAKKKQIDVAIDPEANSIRLIIEDYAKGSSNDLPKRPKDGKSS